MAGTERCLAAMVIFFSVKMRKMQFREAGNWTEATQ